MLDILAVRERGSRRETRLLNILLFIKGPLWKVLAFASNIVFARNNAHIEITSMLVYMPMCDMSELSARKNTHTQLYAHAHVLAQDTHAQTKQNGSAEHSSSSVCV